MAFTSQTFSASHLMARKQSSPKRQKYVCEVVIETDRKMAKKEIKAWLEAKVTMTDRTLFDGRNAAEVTAARVRAVDLD